MTLHTGNPTSGSLYCCHVGETARGRAKKESVLVARNMPLMTLEYSIYSNMVHQVNIPTKGQRVRPIKSHMTNSFTQYSSKR
jgi:hypothetical protein